MKLRKYQKALNKPTLKFLTKSKEQRAQIYAPTGAGKTTCFMSLVLDAIDRGLNNILILHPRLALSSDQLRRFKIEMGTVARYTSFHSGKHITGSETIREINTTDQDELRTVIDQTHDMNMPHITFSTYNSFHRLKDIKFDLAICDEAHYLVQEQFYEHINDINADKILMYTATPVTYEMEESGMLDYSVFGKVIAKVEPSELIKLGYIVAPLVHQLRCSTNNAGDDVDIVDLVARAYVSQYEDITKHGMPYHQMLVAARSVEGDLRTLERETANLWRQISTISNGVIVDPVDLYTIDAGGAYLNGRPLPSRDHAINMIRNSKKNAIVVHYDTISEGIDIDTLCGVLFMRRMSKAKVLQTIGRCARPYKGDLSVKNEPRKKFFNPKQNIDIRSKPRCVVTLPTIDGKWIANDDGSIIAEAFILGGYGDLTTYMVSPTDDPKGTRTTVFELDEDETISSAVLSHTIERNLVDLRKLFDFGEAK